jgi:hypothetical protein
LTSYRALLAQMGTTWAAELRQIASARAFMQKRRYYSDKAVAEMALALAERDLEGAWELARSIQDASQRMRAVAAVAGQLARLEPAAFRGAVRIWPQLGELGAQSGDRAAARLVRDELSSLLQGETSAGPVDRDYLLSAAIQQLAPLAPAAAEELSSDLESPAFIAKALVDVASGTAELGLPADSAWERAWAAAQATADASATLGLAVAHIACRWYAAGDARAGAALARALDALRGESSRLERIDATIEIASALAPFQPDQAQTLLDEARRLAGDLEAGPAQGQALSRIVGAQMELDPGLACRLLADLRRMGRDSFLDGAARLVPGAARLGGTALVERIAGALSEGMSFFAS